MGEWLAGSVIRAPALAAIFALGSLAWAPTADAATVAILPRTGGTGVGPAAREEALEAARRVLENDGWTVFSIAEASAPLPAHLSSCGPDDRCAYELRAVIGVDATVGLRLYGTEREVERVEAVVVGLRGVGHRASVRVEPDRPLPFAMAESIRAATSMWSSGAELRGDAESIEHAPAREIRRESSPLSFALGGLLVLGSAPLLGFGVNTAVRDGECVTDGPGGTCLERVRFREGAGIFTGLGAALLIAGIVVMIAQPIQLTVVVDDRSASLRVRGSF